MTIIRGIEPKIEISIDGQKWIGIRSWNEPAQSTPRAHIEALRAALHESGAASIMQSAALSMIPSVQIAADSLRRAEEQQYRAQQFGTYTLGGIIKVDYFNRGLFEALGGAHTRHAMRHRKLERYRQKMRLDKMRS